MNTIERKCLKCGTWNKSEDHCTHCGNTLSPVLIEKEEAALREERRLSLPKDKLDQLMDRAKNSRYWFVRAFFYVVYSFALLVFAIASFFVYLVAWSPG